MPVFCWVCLLLFFLAPSVRGQELLDLVGLFGRQMVGNEGARLKQHIDSIDFQFAMTVSENAGFFDVQNKGEYKAGFLADFKTAGQKSLIEIARDSLEFGLGQYGIRRYKKAEESFQRAKRLLEQANATDHIVYLRIVSSLGLAYLVQGRWLEAEKNIAWSVEKSKNTLGKQSAAYIANLNNQAKLHQALGKYNEAEQEFEEAIKLSESLFGGSMQTAIVTNNAAMLAGVLGRNELAIGKMNEAINYSIKGQKKIIEGQSFDNRRFRLNLGTLLLAQGKLTEAENIFLLIKKEADNRGQTKSQEYGTLLNLMGVLYLQMGNNEKVEEYLLKSLDVYRKRFTDVNYLSAKVLNDLGNFYRLRGRFEDAERRLSASLAMRQSIYEPTHPDFVKTQEDLAILYWRTGRIEKAYPLYKEVMDKTMVFIREYFGPMSEAEKSKYWATTESRFQRFFNFALDAKSQLPILTNDFYEYHLATKSILLNATSKIRKHILTGNDNSLKEDYLAWLDLKEQLMEAYTYSKIKQKAQNIDREELEQRANKMERTLSSRSTSFANEYDAGRTTTKQISTLLGEHEAVVDIVRVTTFHQSFTDESRYVVFVLKQNEDTPHLVVLDRGKELESRSVKFYRNAVKITDTLSYRSFWASIEPEVAAKKKIYVSLDGVYNQINLNTLQKTKKEYLISKYDFVLLGNAKDLLGIKTSPINSGSTEATLVGFPNYGSGFEPLPGTEVELEAISKILKAKNVAVSTYIRSEASENRIKLLNNPAILHVASHGYFFPDTEMNTGTTFGIQNQNANQNPLLRSGLVLSGATAQANTANIAATDDGFLTAYEVVNLNLEKTGLVILSACETALGDVRFGEGVYGLQRAFSLAGAKAIIMSLWKVDDAATQQLMTNFYTNWVSGGDILGSFKKAQLQLKEKFPAPYYWGAFVVTGI